MDQFVAFLGDHYILSSIWVFIALLIAYSYVQSAKSGSKNLSVQEATLLINRENAILLDIRPNADFKKGHILDAVNVSVDKVDEQIADLEKYKSKPIIVTCATGMQSGAVALKLRKAGFEQVHRLQGGMQSWQAESLPLHKA